MTDQQLISRFADGDVEAFNTLVWRWQKPIFNFTMRYIGVSEDAKDITQRVFIKVHKNLKSLKDNGKFSSWLYQIALNLCRDESKSRYRRSKSSLDALQETINFDISNETDESAYKTHSPEAVLQRSDLRSLLDKALEKIPKEQKEVVIMKEFQGLKFIEIADVLNLPVNTVKSRMYYGLSALRKVMDHWKIDLEAAHYEL